MARNDIKSTFSHNTILNETALGHIAAALQDGASVAAISPSDAQSAQKKIKSECDRKRVTFF